MAAVYEEVLLYLISAPVVVIGPNLLVVSSIPVADTVMVNHK